MQAALAYQQEPFKPLLQRLNNVDLHEWKPFTCIPPPATIIEKDYRVTSIFESAAVVESRVF